MCCYRDPKNLERFSLITQGIIFLAVEQLKDLVKDIGKEPDHDPKDESSPKGEKDKNDNKKNADFDKLASAIQDRDKLLILVSKIFLLNFPLYVAFKHTLQAKYDELSQQEIQNLNFFCDIHDSEIPMFLLRNVSLFCKWGGLHAMTACFTHLSPEHLPVSTAHSMISVGRCFCKI